MREISEELLIQMAGDAAYKRGLVYYKQGHVGELKLKGKTIIAEVEGSAIYQVTLKHTSKLFDGSCDCPASEGFDFCKHCVATALVYRDQLQQDKTLQGSTTKDRLPNYLMTLDKQQLVAMLLEQLRNDRNALAQLTIKADMAAGKLNDKAIKKQITAATPLNKHLHSYPQVRNYFARLDAVLSSLDAVMPDLPANKALALTDYAIARVDRALDTIDDSGGFRFDALERLASWHERALSAAALPATDLAAYLFSLFMRPESEFYPSIPDEYEDMLGEEGMQVFMTKLRVAWDALPPLQEKDWAVQGDYMHLLYPLKYEAISRNDSEAVIALYAKIACDFGDFLKLSDLCLEHNMFDQALWWRKRAETAKNKPYSATAALENNQIALWLFHKDYTPVLELLWQRFAKWPSVEHYQEIIAIKGQKDNKQNRAKAIELAKQAVNNQNKFFGQFEADKTIAELHLHFQEFEQALALAETSKLPSHLLVKIASANPQHAERVLPLLFRASRAFIESSSNDGYHRAIDTLKLANELAGKQYAHQVRQVLDDLLAEFKRKRNFCQWLREAFTGL